jgi:hypothetical protein
MRYPATHTHTLRGRDAPPLSLQYILLLLYYEPSLIQDQCRLFPLQLLCRNSYLPQWHAPKRMDLVSGWLADWRWTNTSQLQKQLDTHTLHFLSFVAWIRI